MRTLSIGNSFSQDTTAYLHQLAESAGLYWECVNLFLPSCSLQMHAENLRSDAPVYSLEINGQTTGQKISLRAALTTLGAFNRVTLQQLSDLSGFIDSYFPYLSLLTAEIARLQPEADVWLHQTWAYEHDFTHEEFELYGRDQMKMYLALRDAYYEASERTGLPMIRLGDAVQAVRDQLPELDCKNGGRSLNRDGIHLSIPVGRMFAAYVWFKALTGLPLTKATFLPEGTSDEDRTLLEKLKNWVDTRY